MKRFVVLLTVLAGIAAACLVWLKYLDRVFEHIYGAQEAAGARRQEMRDEE